MPNFEFTIPLGPALELNAATSQVGTLLVSKAGDWIVRHFRVGESTTINGIMVPQVSTVGAGVSLDGIVGISTSLPPNGLFPYTVNELRANNTAGVALTIAFEYSITANFTAGTGDSQLKFFTNSNSTYTCQPNVDYYAGIYISSVGTAGTINIRAQTGPNTTNSQFFSNFFGDHVKKAWQRISGSSSTSINTPPEIIPYFYNGTSYNFQTMSPPHGDIAFGNLASVISNTNERYGTWFELNNLGVQDVFLKGIIVNKIRWTSATKKIWPVLCDGYDTTKVIAVGSTIQSGDAALGDNPSGSIMWFNFFAPPVKIRPDYRYFLAINADSISTTQDYIGFFIRNPAVTDHSAQAGYIQTGGSAATAFVYNGANIVLNAQLLLEAPTRINRSIGN